MITTDIVEGKSGSLILQNPKVRTSQNTFYKENKEKTLEYTPRDFTKMTMSNAKEKMDLQLKAPRNSEKKKLQLKVNTLNSGYQN